MDKEYIADTAPTKEGAPGNDAQHDRAALIEMAAEQFARLLWEQVSFPKKPPPKKKP